MDDFMIMRIPQLYLLAFKREERYLRDFYSIQLIEEEKEKK